MKLLIRLKICKILETYIRKKTRHLDKIIQNNYNKNTTNGHLSIQLPKVLRENFGSKSLVYCLSYKFVKHCRSSLRYR